MIDLAPQTDEHRQCRENFARAQRTIIALREQIAGLEANVYTLTAQQTAMLDAHLLEVEALQTQCDVLIERNLELLGKKK